ncbi:hypothetical protein [Bosea sp. FBZP-16]|uniref:hypothetical protein n=1 Tax=Bosea sp. FBZP-16 TaxID=2065382 RepID=UPI001319FE3A|nr:hypothetical protein [Bosea sp. FBZP-16]
MTATYITAPEDPNDTTEYRRILEDLRATDADNDNEPAPRRAHSTSPRHRAWQEAFAPLMDWKRLREATEAGSVGSNWMLAPGDSAAPTNAEASLPKDFSEETLILAASYGVRWKQVGGRLVPADGQIEYDAAGRLIRCGALIIAGEPIAANDDEEPKPLPVADADKVEVIGGVKRPTEREDDIDDPEDRADDLADILGRNLNPTESIDRGRRYGAKVRSGSIVGILHRTKNSDKVVVRTEPRNADGRYRPRKGKRPPAGYVIPPDEVIDSQRFLPRLLKVMSAEAVIVLDFALRAANLANIGEVFGKSGKNAERVGKQKLIEACAEFESAVKQFAEEDGARQQAIAA